MRSNVTLEDLFLYECGYYKDENGEIKKMHKKIEKKAAKALDKDAKTYHEAAAHSRGMKKKHEQIEEKEARSAARLMKAKAKKAHDY